MGNDIFSILEKLISGISNNNILTMSNIIYLMKIFFASFGVIFFIIIYLFFKSKSNKKRERQQILQRLDNIEKQLIILNSNSNRNLDV